MAFVAGSSQPPRSVDDHLRAVLGDLEPLSPYEVPLLEALGLPVCEDVTAPADLPRFDNSAMDGYAVRAGDVAAASEQTPQTLPVVGESAAGSARSYELDRRAAIKIMTGAALPAGADSVVPVEWTDAGSSTVRITRAPEPRQHVRPAGEDVAAGDVVVRSGTVVGPRQIGVLATVGRSQVRARPRPRVVVISTGDELREPGQPLAVDSIYDGNSFMLAAAVRAAGATAYRVGLVPDEPRAFANALNDQLGRADLVVTSGGVSKGEHDVVKEVLSKLGTVEFCEVGMQPGKPQGYGRVGDDSVPIFTLPGNPVSAYVSFEVFVLPALRRLMGRKPHRRPARPAALLRDVKSSPGRRQFVRASYEETHRGASVVPVGGTGSHLIADLASANALIVVPEDTTSLSAGDTVSVLALDRDF
jgi:molybdopterin molybdotransferase